MAESEAGSSKMDVAEPEKLSEVEIDQELGISSQSFADDVCTGRKCWQPVPTKKKRVVRRLRSQPLPCAPVDTQSVWDEYFKKTGSLPQDVSCFTHLNHMNSNHCHIKLHVGHWIVARHGNDNYWPAEIILVCGRVLKLRWFGASCNQYFWCDIKSKIGLLPLQTTENIDKCPPNCLNLPPGPASDMIRTMGASFSSAPSPSLDVLNSARSSRAEEFVQGTELDMQDPHDPTQVCRVKVMESKGGYLLLRSLHWLTECTLPLAPDLWVFCTSQLLHEADWVYSQLAKEHNITVQEKKPETGGSGTDFCSSRLKKHEFVVGMKLELLDSVTRTRFLPATVIQVLSPYYFVIVPDSYTSHLQTSEINAAKVENSGENVQVEVEKLPKTPTVPQIAEGPRIVCHRQSPGIFPVNWCNKYALRISPPNGWPIEEEFSWSVYLQVTGGLSTNETLFDLDHFENEFLVDRKLEVVDWTSCEVLRMRPATVTRTMKQLVWIKCDDEVYASPTRIYDCRSPLLFPCGWSTTYNIAFNVPEYRQICVDKSTLYKDVPFACRRKDIYSVVNPEKQYMPKRLTPSPYGNCAWCPAIYLNINCYCGPHLNPEYIRYVPKVIGPGPLLLVLQKLIKCIVSCAYRPKEVLQELVHPPCTRNVSEKTTLIEVKVRNKTRRYRGNVQVCKSAQDLSEWSRQFLSKLDACPLLFSIDKTEHESKCEAKCYSMLQYDMAVYKPLLKKSCKKRLTKRLRRPSRMGDGGTARRFARFRPDRSIANINRKRPKPVAVVEGRRPVTRGIKLPRPDQMRRPGTIEEPAGGQVRRTSLRKPFSAVKPNTCSSGAMVVSKPLCAVKPAAHGQAASSAEETKHTYNLPPVLTNPQNWSVDQLCQWINQTDSISVVQKLRDELVDGQAFLLLTLDECRQYLGLKFGPALKLTGIIEGLKQIFIEKFEGTD